MAERSSPSVEIGELSVRVDRSTLTRLTASELADRVQAQLPASLRHRRDVAKAVAERVAGGDR